MSASDRIIPKLFEGEHLDPEIYAGTTCFTAGHLVSKNAGWRDARPVIATENCTGCLKCYEYCPDGCIREEGDIVAVDYDFCKGCGICVRMCRFDCITMVPEKEA